MPYIETVDDLVDELADMLGIFGSGGDFHSGVHDENCHCRVCFTNEWVTRIHRAVDNERKIGDEISS